LFEEVAVTGSTNADLIARASAGAQEGLWLRADAQNAGRGRMGRVWESANGNVFASTIVRVGTSDPPVSSLGFVAALAVHDTIRQIAADVPIMIKWPNDILTMDGAKLCGILLERTGDAIVIGFGINLSWHPTELVRPVTDLRAEGANPPPPQAVVEMLADFLTIWLERWRIGGLAPILKSWQSRTHRHGTALSVHLPSNEILEGLYSGLDEDGALMLRLANGEIRAIHAADIFLI
jgi:BirA family transcriptional regulator, biotin operon repressor / biotin---[acetyl-CoA-carboxylase] ligase